MPTKRLAGHTFLAKLGKRRLRPGGVKATNFLTASSGLHQGSTVLEVACNQGTSAIAWAKQYGCTITAIDLDAHALEIAKENSRKANVFHQIEFQQADARALPFPDERFDIVINEAMLTMLSEQDKALALQEYYRVLKPGGILLTHDVLLRTSSEQQGEIIRQELSRAIYVNVHPYTKEDWLGLFETLGYTIVDSKSGAMSLMNPIGMIQDEGLSGAVQIVLRGLSKKNRRQFMTMFKTFNRHKEDLGYIAVVSRK